MELKDKLHYLSNEDQTSIEKIVKCFVEALNPIAVYLFGSIAENRQTKDSDYDFYIIVNDKTKEKLFNLCFKAQTSITESQNRACDIIVNKESIFNHAKNNVKALEYNVYKNGVKLYEQ